MNLQFIFERIFSLEPRSGYPPHRAKTQAEGRRLLESIGKISHASFVDIVENIDEQVIRPVLDFPGGFELIYMDSLADERLKVGLKKGMRK